MHHLSFVFDTVIQSSSIGLTHEEALGMYSEPSPESVQ